MANRMIFMNQPNKKDDYFYTALLFPHLQQIYKEVYSLNLFNYDQLLNFYKKANKHLVMKETCSKLNYILNKNQIKIQLKFLTAQNVGHMSANLYIDLIKLNQNKNFDFYKICYDHLKDWFSFYIDLGIVYFFQVISKNFISKKSLKNKFKTLKSKNYDLKENPLMDFAFSFYEDSVNEIIKKQENYLSIEDINVLERDILITLLQDRKFDFDDFDNFIKSENSQKHFFNIYTHHFTINKEK